MHADYAWWLQKTKLVGDVAGVANIGLKSAGSLWYVGKELAKDYAVDKGIEHGTPYIMQAVPSIADYNARLWYGE